MTDDGALVAAAGPREPMLTWLAARTEPILLALIVAAVAAKFLLIFRINVHWDEFYFLTFVHDYARGTLDSRFQTFHVHLFSWLTGLETDEIGQIIAARVVIAVLAAACVPLVYGLARHFAAREAALFGTLAYLSLSVVIEHGTSFRTDPIATFLVLVALVPLLRVSARWIGLVLGGAALALAALVTIKTAFYLPVAAAVIWCVSPSPGVRLRRGIILGAAFAATFVLLFLLHATSLHPTPQVAASSYLGGTASKVLFKDGLFPRWADFLIVVGQNVLFWFMAIMGGILAWQRARSTRTAAGWLPLALALPLLTPLIYRNAFAYYFVFALPPAAVLIALFFEERRRKAADPKSPAAAIIALIVVGLGVFLAICAWRNSTDEIAPQRVMLAAVHEIFPKPVPYTDGFGVVASFPCHGFFMSTWGMQVYQQAGRPFYPEVVAEAQPPLLLADSPSLLAAMNPNIMVKPERQMLPGDIQFLRDNYLHHWGMVFVAGKNLSGSGAFDLVIAGDYRLESAAPVVLDGKPLQPGAVVTLAVGQHLYEAGPAKPAVLRWAAAQAAPDIEPVDMFTFFGVEQ